MAVCLYAALPQTGHLSNISSRLQQTPATMSARGSGCEGWLLGNTPHAAATIEEDCVYIRHHRSNFKIKAAFQSQCKAAPPLAFDQTHLERHMTVPCTRSGHWTGVTAKHRTGCLIDDLPTARATVWSRRRSERERSESKQRRKTQSLWAHERK